MKWDGHGSGPRQAKARQDGRRHRGADAAGCAGAVLAVMFAIGLTMVLAGLRRRRHYAMTRHCGDGMGRRRRLQGQGEQQEPGQHEADDREGAVHGADFSTRSRA
jgi:hypothetical protein